MKDITLNDLLAISISERMRLLVPMTQRLEATVDVDTTDSAQVDDIVDVYGTMLVKAIDVGGMTCDKLFVELKR